MFCALKIFAKLTNKSLIVRLRMTSFQNAMKWPQTTANFPYPSSSYNNNNNISITTVNNNHSNNNHNKYRGRRWRELKWRRSWLTAF